MKQITLRGVDPNLDQRLRTEAGRRGMSINRFVLSILRQALGLESDGRQAATVRHHDLDHLAGTWTAEEAAAFDGQLAAQRSIDEDLWQ